MNPPTVLPPEACPLCGQPNQCAQEIERATGQKQAPCWCTQATFSTALWARIPDAARNQACVCQVCSAGPDANGAMPADVAKSKP
ncbi:MAG: cysteine-rich CWC family protein [Candidatus Saccharibacteria bacterium]|nr:cysteine-rich CWC family protein [Rhodoferax sp.]